MRSMVDGGGEGGHHAADFQIRMWGISGAGMGLAAAAVAHMRLSLLFVSVGNNYSYRGQPCIAPSATQLARDLE